MLKEAYFVVARPRLGINVTEPNYKKQSKDHGNFENERWFPIILFLLETLGHDYFWRGPKCLQNTFGNGIQALFTIVHKYI